MENSIFFCTDRSIVPDDVPPDIPFSDFYRIYYSDMVGRLKQTTLARKDAMVRDKIMPFFASMPMDSISPAAIRQWQNGLIARRYSDTYLKTIDMHLLSIFKYASKYYDIPNPYAKAEHMGGGGAAQMKFWTPEQYRAFIRAFSGRPMQRLAFEMLYWCGIRVGELLALTPADIDVKNHLLRISKTYVRLGGQDLITPPKTRSGVRDVALPDFLTREANDYIRERHLKKSDRLIPRSADFIKYHLREGCEKSGVPRIRIHDIRHSHVSLLIDQGFTAAAIAERVGHKHISTTMNVYAHLFPDRKATLVRALERMREGTFEWEAGHE